MLLRPTFHRSLRYFTTLPEARAVADTLSLPCPFALLSALPRDVLEEVPGESLQTVALLRPDAWKQVKGRVLEQLRVEPENTSLYLTTVVGKLRVKYVTMYGLESLGPRWVGCRTG